MAEIVYQSMTRNGVTTPSTAATRGTQSTAEGDPGFGLLMTTAINAECLVDPDDKVGFLLMNPGTSTGVTVSIAAGSGWQGNEALTFAFGDNSTNVGSMVFVGPLESAKYVRYDSTTIGVGKPHIALSLTTVTAGAVRVVAFKMPTVEYDT